MASSRSIRCEDAGFRVDHCGPIKSGPCRIVLTPTTVDETPNTTIPFRTSLLIACRVERCAGTIPYHMSVGRLVGKC